MEQQLEEALDANRKLMAEMEQLNTKKECRERQDSERIMREQQKTKLAELRLGVYPVIFSRIFPQLALPQVKFLISASGKLPVTTLADQFRSTQYGGSHSLVTEQVEWLVLPIQH